MGMQPARRQMNAAHGASVKQSSPLLQAAGTHHFMPRHPDHMLLQKVQDRREVGCGIQQVKQLIPAGAAFTWSAMLQATMCLTGASGRTAEPWPQGQASGCAALAAVSITVAQTACVC